MVKIIMFDDFQLKLIEVKRNIYTHTQGDQKVSVHLMIPVQKNKQKYFKQFQSLIMITYLEMG
jgi:hypothetical protein